LQQNKIASVRFTYHGERSRWDNRRNLNRCIPGTAAGKVDSGKGSQCEYPHVSTVDRGQRVMGGLWFSIIIMAHYYYERLCLFNGRDYAGSEIQIQWYQKIRATFFIEL
jgi:hypothetical protein